MLARHELFISHSNKDKALAEELCAELELRGFQCWIAPRNIEPGAEYSQALNAAISNASIFLLVLSTNASQSRHVRRELEVADRKGIPILPLRVENTNLFENLDYFVSTQQWYDALSRPLASNLGALEEALRNRLGDPESARLWKELGGPLADRYAVQRPRALLSLDGGGVRALITVEILARMEELLAAQSTNSSTFRLCDYFDFVAGAGTGGLIAIALARGKSTREVLAFFVANASDLFGKEVRPLHSFFQSTIPSPSSRLEEGLGDLIGRESTLSPESLRCLVMVLMRNPTSNAPWATTNNPLAKYNDPRRPDSIRRFPLLPLARASMTWSPLANPEIVNYRDANSRFLFSDGTFTPYANPAFVLYQTATSEGYRLKWNRGERNLLLVSVGSGAIGPAQREAGISPTLEELLVPFMNITAMDQDIKCRTVGRCIHGGLIDREVGDLIPRERDGQIVAPSKDTGREFTYVRYQVDLAPAGLAALGGNDPHVCDPERTFDLRSQSDLESLRDIGRLAANAVSEEHFSAVRIPTLLSSGV